MNFSESRVGCRRATPNAFGASAPAPQVSGKSVVAASLWDAPAGREGSPNGQMKKGENFEPSKTNAESSLSELK
jgi:hypothetical protein